MQFQIKKVTSQPGIWDNNTLYLVQNGSYAEIYMTSSTGTPKMVGNSTMINALIDAKIASSSAGALKVYATISARNADQSNLAYNQLVLVKDATGDTTVSSGAALYVFEYSSNTFSKIAEFESMDVVLSWDNITGKPSSTVSQIDAAVTNSHTHGNKSELDKYSSDGSGNATYNGQPILQTITTNW